MSVEKRWLFFDFCLLNFLISNTQQISLFQIVNYAEMARMCLFCHFSIEIHHKTQISQNYFSLKNDASKPFRTMRFNIFLQKLKDCGRWLVGRTRINFWLTKWGEKGRFRAKRVVGR